MVLVAESQAELFLKAVRVTGMIAATFTQPSTHISVQLKGRDATSARARAADVELSKVNLDRFVEDAAPLGYPEDVLRAVFWSDPADLIAITFSPIAAFLQTPGPRAGEALSL
jgi:hypothetical protein